MTTSQNNDLRQPACQSLASRPTDYCAACGESLIKLPSGSRVSCHPGARMYWSHLEPLPADARGFRQLTGLEVSRQGERYDFKPGSETYGRRIDHAPLFLYRAP